MRVPTKEDAESVSETISRLKPKNPMIELEIIGGFGRPPMEATARNRKLWNRAQQAGELLGIDLTEGTAGGGSDGNTTSLYTATLDGLGTPGDGAHAAHEFIMHDKLVERTALLTMLLLAAPIRLETSTA